MLGVVKFKLGLLDFRVWGVAKFSDGLWVLGLVRRRTLSRPGSFSSTELLRVTLRYLNRTTPKLQEDPQGFAATLNEQSM